MRWEFRMRRHRGHQNADDGGDAVVDKRYRDRELLDRETARCELEHAPMCLVGIDRQVIFLEGEICRHRDASATDGVGQKAMDAGHERVVELAVEEASNRES